MAFSKFDPHRPDEAPEATAGDRRAVLLRYGWIISTVYTLFGFLMIAYFMFWR